jgi:uncharacterized membrane protein
MKKKFIFVTNMLSLLVVLIAIIKFYPVLPERIPIHFGLNGQPNGWDGKSSIWFLYFVQFGINFLLLGVTAAMPWLRRHPEWTTSGKRILDLPPEQQDRYWRAAEEMLLLLSLGVNLVFVFLTRGTILVALKRQSSLSWTPLLIVVLILIVAWFWAIKLLRLSRPARRDGQSS